MRECLNCMSAVILLLLAGSAFASNQGNLRFQAPCSFFYKDGTPFGTKVDPYVCDYLQTNQPDSLRNGLSTDDLNRAIADAAKAQRSKGIETSQTAQLESRIAGVESGANGSGTGALENSTKALQSGARGDAEAGRALFDADSRNGSPSQIPSETRLPDQAAAGALEGRSYTHYAGASADGAAAPAAPISPDDLEYHAAGAEKPNRFMATLYGIRNTLSFDLSKMTPGDTQHLEHLKQTLSSTDSGAKEVKELGGWDGISKTVEIRYASTAGGSVAYARPLLPYEQSQAGKKYALVLNPAFKDKPDVEVVPVIAHELSHVRDMEHHPQNPFLDGLQIPSEYGAHRTQMHVYEELKAKASPAELAKADRDGIGQEERFDAALWEDRLLQKYKTDADFQARFSNKNLRAFAGQAWTDARDRGLSGTAHLDYHVNDLYHHLSYENDIADKKPVAGVSAAERDRYERLTEERQTMMRGFDAEDAAFRRAHGFPTTEAPPR